MFENIILKNGNKQKLYWYSMNITILWINTHFDKARYRYPNPQIKANDVFHRLLIFHAMVIFFLPYSSLNLSHSILCISSNWRIWCKYYKINITNQTIRVFRPLHYVKILYIYHDIQYIDYNDDHNDDDDDNNNDYNVMINF